MNAKEIKNIGRKLNAFLKQFDDCFYRSQPRGHLKSYVRGQVSSLQRKSVEPIALLTKTSPRTLQRFLSYVHWDEQRLRDRIQWIVIRDHTCPAAIGTVDDTGHPKQAGIPEEVVYRKKTDIALVQISHALNNGIQVFAWTFDRWYGKDGQFLDGLQNMGQNYVAEVPASFTGWVKEPRILLNPRTEKSHKPGRNRHFPSLSAKALPPSEVQNLLVYSRKFQKQKWKKFYIKEGEKGPVVWEVKRSKFYRKQGEHGLPGLAHCLIVARNVLNPDEIKYFVSNILPGSNGVTLEKLLEVAFSRWPIERCFKLAKNEIGMDHFEVRSWCGIHHHLYISQLSQLFCCRVHQDLKEKNSGQFVSDGRAGSLCGIRVGSRSELSAFGSETDLLSSRRDNPIPTKTQSGGSRTSFPAKAAEIASFGCRSREVTLLSSG